MKGNEQLKEYGKRLRLYHLCNHMDELLHVAQQDKPTYHEFLMGLLEREITCREKKDYERRLSAARLPQRHDLDLYDFNFAEGITQYQLKELRQLDGAGLQCRTYGTFRYREDLHCGRTGL